MTASDLIKTQLRLIGALASGETATSAEETDALAANNRMLGSWSAQRLLIYSITSETFTLTVDKQQYGMGSGSDLDTARPQKIVNASMRYTTDPISDLPIEIITNKEWSRITAKGISSALPTKLYVDYSYPNLTLNFWPIPNAAKTVVIDSLKPLTSFTGGTDTLSLPPEYEDALVYNGAKRLATEFGKAVPAEVMELASKSLKLIKKINSKPQFLYCDEATLSRSGYATYVTGDVE